MESYNGHLQQYFKEIDSIPLLSREEEYSLAKAMVDGDTSAKEKLIQANLRFVVQVAKKYQGKGLPLEDLINEGNIGLIHAADRFDPDRGYHFISYAVWWIKQTILKSFNEKVKQIRLPANRAQELMKIQSITKDLENEYDRAPTLEEIAFTAGLSTTLVSDLLSVSQPVSTLNPVEDPTFDTSLRDTKTQTPEAVVMDKHLRSDINKVLRILSNRESEIIEYRFGLNDKRKHSLNELGEKYNLTKERIRQIEKGAIRKLQTSEEAAHLYSYSH